MEDKVEYTISKTDYTRLISLARLGANQVEEKFGIGAHSELDKINRSTGYIKAE